MAHTNHLGVVSMRASSNVSALTLDSNGNYSSGGIPQGVCVILDTADGTTNAVTLPGGTGVQIVGISDTAPAAGTGQAVKVVTGNGSIVRLKAHAAITQGASLMVAATDGTVGAASAIGTTSIYTIGQALEAAAEAGDFISVLLQITAQNVNA